MAGSTVDSSSLRGLAGRIERDIRSRGLVPGDRYLTSAEAGILLGVSAATAHRAMTILVDRQLLVRRRRSGTFVGPRAESWRAGRVQSVYVLATEQGTLELPPADLLIQGIRSAVAGAGIHFSFLPASGRVPLVRQLLETPLRTGELAGVVPVSCGREVYRFLAEHGVPTVVFGSLYAPQERLSSIDADSREIGRLLVEHLVSGGLSLLKTRSALPCNDLRHLAESARYIRITDSKDLGRSEAGDSAVAVERLRRQPFAHADASQ